MDRGLSPAESRRPRASGFGNLPGSPRARSVHGRWPTPSRARGRDPRVAGPPGEADQPVQDGAANAELRLSGSEADACRRIREALGRPHRAVVPPLAVEAFEPVPPSTPTVQSRSLPPAPAPS